MNKIPSLSRLKEWDKITGERLPGGSYALMEKASRAVTEYILAACPGLCDVHVFCGHGNNGGDGYAISRMLLFYGYRVTVYGIQTGRIQSPDALKNLKRLRELGVDIQDPLSFSADLVSAGSVIVDAMLGYGLNRSPTGIYQQLIEKINPTSALKIAVDIPSGLFYENRTPSGTVFKADVTVTLGVYKPAFLIPENVQYTGRVILKDIGLDSNFGKTVETSLYWLEKSDARAGIIPRTLYGHKYRYGHLLAVGGSPGKAGAIYMSAKAAFRVGAGLVSFLSVPTNMPILQTLLPAAMVLPPATADSPDWELPALPAKINTVICGPGMGTTPQAKSCLPALFVELKKRHIPAVIDADALNLIAEDAKLAEHIPAGSILTPHVGEFKRLIAGRNWDINDDKAPTKLATRLNSVVVVKDRVTLIADPSGKTYASAFGHPVLSKAGTGDILAGIIAGILSQGVDSLQAAITGVIIHGFCAQAYANHSHENSLIATDLTEYIADVLNEI